METTHSNTLAWRIPWTEQPSGLHTVHEVARVSWLNDWVFTLKPKWIHLLPIVLTLLPNKNKVYVLHTQSHKNYLDTSCRYLQILYVSVIIVIFSNLSGGQMNTKRSLPFLLQKGMWRPKHGLLFGFLFLVTDAVKVQVND